MKILIIGGGGQVGSKLIHLAQNDHELYSTYLTRKPDLPYSNIFKFDKTNRDSAFDLVSSIKPDVIIDTAALHNVGLCEQNPDMAIDVNYYGTKNLVDASNKLESRFIFISTDYVFDGIKGNYFETDNVNPINYYGHSKYIAENYISKKSHNYAICRTAVVFGVVQPNSISSSGKPQNFALWLIQQLKQLNRVTIFTDQISSMTLSDNLAEALIKVSNSNINGIFHTAGSTPLSRFDFSVKLAEKLKLDSTLISPITTNELNQNARRPLNASLNVSKVRDQISMNMLDIEESLQIFSHQYKEVLD